MEDISDVTTTKSFVKALSSPEIIKSVTRTLTPPISPQHHHNKIIDQQTGLRLNSDNAASRVSPPSSTASNPCQHIHQASGQELLPSADEYVV